MRTRSRVGLWRALFITAFATACSADDLTVSSPDIRSLRGTANVHGPSDPFFVAWASGYQSQNIVTQAWSGPFAQQYRQHAGFYADQAILNFAAAYPGKLYINGDEPDQSCISPYDYAEIYRNFVNAVRNVDPTARFSPAGFAEPNDACCPGGNPCFTNMHSVGYADQFYNRYVERYGGAPLVHEWRFHDFGLIFATGDITSWWNRVSNAAAWSRNHGANMVLGSWGFLLWNEPTASFQAHLQQAMDLVYSDTRINQAVWWSYQDTGYIHYLSNPDGSLTPEGWTYHTQSLLRKPTAEIFGNDAVGPNIACVWSATVNGGRPPYHYSWSVNNAPVGYDSENLSYANDGYSFSIELRVTDAFGAVGQTSKAVSVEPGYWCM